MKLLSRWHLLLCLVLFSSNGFSEEISFFSLVNAVRSSEPTVLTVDGEKIGEPFALGFYTGGLGFTSKNVAVSIQNGNLPAKQLALALSAENSVIVIAFLKEENERQTDDPSPKETIETLILPCSTESSKSRVRAVLAGSDVPVTMAVSMLARENPEGSSGEVSIQLKPGVPVEVPLKASALKFSRNGKAIAVHEVEGNDNWLLVFFPDANGGWAMATAIDSVFR